MTEDRLTLGGQRVLLIAPRFFGYEDEIRKELIERGAEVDLVLDRPFASAAMKALARFRRAWVIPAADRYVRSALEKMGNARYDLVLVVNGQTLSEAMVRGIRLSNPSARFILYLWDSAHNRSSSVAMRGLFDRALTFDPDDAARLNLHFRPLFFGKKYAQLACDPTDLDVSFIGTIHTDRYEVVTETLRQMPAGSKAWTYFYLPAKWVFWVQKLINGSFRKARIEEFSFVPLPPASVHDIFRRSRAVLDVEHPRQGGLTIRTLEAFGARKKLITTNAAVRDYDLYHPSRVIVIDRRDPSVPSDFFNTVLVPAPPEIYEKYSIQGWMDDVLAEGEVG